MKTPATYGEKLVRNNLPATPQFDDPDWWRGTGREIDRAILVAEFWRHEYERVSTLGNIDSSYNALRNILDKDADEFAQNVLDEALAARDWLIRDKPAPSEGWACLVVEV